MNFLLSAMNASRIKCALISLEMPLSEILSRMIVQMSENVPLRDLLNPDRLQPRHWKDNPDRLKNIMEKIGKARKRTDQIQQEGIYQAKALANFSPDVAVGQHRSFRPPGGPRCVEQPREVMTIRCLRLSGAC